MIKSLFRQMWNQRHANVWVWVELVVVLVLLWYSIDLVYNYEVAARQSKGYDTENVFDIQLNIKPALQNDSVLMSHSAEYLEQIYHLIQQYQGVEEACFYYGTIPYTGNNMYEGYAPHSDSTHQERQIFLKRAVFVTDLGEKIYLVFCGLWLHVFCGHGSIVLWPQGLHR